VDKTTLLAIPVPKKPNHYTWKAISNSLTWPERNTDFGYDLISWPQGFNYLPEKYVKLIQEIPVDKIIEDLKMLQMEYAISAFQERVELLQYLAKQPSMTLYEIALRFQLLGKQEAIEISRLVDFGSAVELARNTTLTQHEMENLLKNVLKKVSWRQIHFLRHKKKLQESKQRS
jgi:hypothetical protein